MGDHDLAVHRRDGVRSGQSRLRNFRSVPHRARASPHPPGRRREAPSGCRSRYWSLDLHEVPPGVDGAASTPAASTPSPTSGPASGLRPVNPAGWPQPKGYANGMTGRGRLVFVAGQIGWTSEQIFATDDFVGQFEQALHNTVAVLEAAGAKPEHIARMTWRIIDKREYLARLPEIGRCWRQIIGRHFPAMALVQVVALVEDRAKIEIETTALVPDAEERGER